MMNYPDRSVCSPCRPHLNFISGENGSGKSAALQCLQVCLGVQARLTGRAKTGKELINDKASVTTAKVVLWNTGTTVLPLALNVPDQNLLLQTQEPMHNLATLSDTHVGQPVCHDNADGYYRFGRVGSKHRQLFMECLNVSGCLACGVGCMQ